MREGKPRLAELREAVQAEQAGGPEGLSTMTRDEILAWAADPAQDSSLLACVELAAERLRSARLERELRLLRDADDTARLRGVVAARDRRIAELEAGLRAAERLLPESTEVPSQSFDPTRSR